MQVFVQGANGVQHVNDVCLQLLRGHRINIDAAEVKGVKQGLVAMACRSVYASTMPLEEQPIKRHVGGVEGNEVLIDGMPR